MKHTIYIVMILGAMFLVACTPEPVEVTRVVEVEKPVEVTREVEITRIVEVENPVEVTREVKIEVEVTREIEVTRLVEVEVTAVPTETPTPLPTNTPAPASPSSLPPTEAPSASVEEELLQAMTAARNDMSSYGGLIDAALRTGVISCQDVVDTYDRVAFAPTFDVSAASDEAQYAYGVYRASIDVFTNGARDMTENCREFLANPQSGGGIGRQQWGLARQEVNTAVDTIHPGIQALGGE